MLQDFVHRVSQHQNVICQSRWILAAVSHIIDLMPHKLRHTFCTITVVYLWAVSHIISRQRKCLWPAWCLIHPPDLQSSIAEPATVLLYCWISGNTQSSQSGGSDTKTAHVELIQMFNVTNCPTFAVVLKTSDDNCMLHSYFCLKSDASIILDMLL